MSGDLRTDVAAELMREACRAAVRPGFYRFQFVKGAPTVGACIGQDENGWSVVVDGCAYPPHPDPALAQMLLDVWAHGRPCSEADYRYLVAVADHAKVHDTEAPQAKPRERYDPLTAKPIF